MKNAFLLVLIAVAIPCTTAAQDGLLRFTGRITLNDLPPTVERRLMQGVDQDEVKRLLVGQPSIVLDGGTLEVSAPTSSRSRSIMINRLELRNGAAIVTNGVNLEIYANTIRSSRGQIVAFVDTDGGPPAEAGQSGATGLSAGTVVLFAKLEGDGVLGINLNGQAGHAGGRGVKGPTGAQGAGGQNGADHLLDCARGGGDGGRGGQGGKGGPGGNGGDGGAGGSLVLRGDIASQRQLIDFSSIGGRGGVGGAGGPPGDGGPGGLGGSGTTWCRAGNAGPTGPGGTEGDVGSRGNPGPDGGIAAD